MNNNVKTSQEPKITVAELTKMAIITALYVVITIALSTISFGVVQFRIAEMFNFLALYKKRYIYAVTLGVAIANLWSQLGIIDVVVGSLATLITLTIVHHVLKKVENEILKYVITIIIVSISMFSIAGIIVMVEPGTPFLATWLTLAIEETITMSIGGVIIYTLNKRLDLANF